MLLRKPGKRAGKQEEKRHKRMERYGSLEFFMCR
jgi:hypothetical protein